MKVVIIGGGASGILLAINLLRLHDHKSLDIKVIDKNPPEMLGVAYSTENDSHLLNVPAYKMSAFPEKSDDFIQWLGNRGYGYQARSFVPRHIYRDYIKDLLKSELEHCGEYVSYTFVNDVALDVLPEERTVQLKSGRLIPFDKLVLALGNFEPGGPALADKEYTQHPAYFNAPWAPASLDSMEEGKNVVILGTGLTMVDTVLTLQQRKHKGKITALSTHGLIPQPHIETVPYSIPDPKQMNVKTVLEALIVLRKHIKAARGQGVGWQAVVDAFRPYVQQIWSDLATEEKKTFMEHLRHIWGVARHRMPGECAERVHQALTAGQLRILAGRIQAIGNSSSGNFCIRYLEKGTKRQVTLESDVVINCMGPESNYFKLKDVFVKNLVKKGMIRTDALQLGIDCTPEGIVIGKNGEPIPYLYTIGPPSRGALWETTSIPEIRSAAFNLARRMTATEWAANPAHLIGPLMELTARAGEAILGIYNDKQFAHQYTLKEDRTPLTKADQTSNAIIVQGLQALTPSIPVISEENGAIPYEIRKHWKYYWCVDPLDGTKEFLKKNGEFCINIALIYEQRPIFGIIYIPISGAFYYGSEETGSWKIAKGQAPVRLYADNQAKRWTVVSSRSHKSLEEVKTDVHPKVSKQIVAGSALKFCLIAEGSAHLYHRHGPTMEWDTAAGHAIVAFSGGKLCTVAGEPFLYNKESLLNGPFICSIDQMV